MLPRNRLKSMLGSDSFAVGTFLKLREPAITEVLGLVGYDFVVLDLEHSALGLESAEDIVRAAESKDMTVLARLDKHYLSEVGRLLESGLQGIQMAHVNSAAEAQAVVEATYYPPLGERSIALANKAARYGLVSPQDYLEWAGENLLVIAQIEDLEGVRALDEIVQVRRIDGIFIGRVDLAQQLGVGLNIKSDKVEAVVEEVLEKSRNAGKPVGTYTGNADECIHLRERGFNFVAISTDVGLLSEGARVALQKSKQVV